MILAPRRRSGRACRRTASSFATPAPPGTALALRATSSRPSTCGTGQVCPSGGQVCGAPQAVSPSCAHPKGAAGRGLAASRSITGGGGRGVMQVSSFVGQLPGGSGAASPTVRQLPGQGKRQLTALPPSSPRTRVGSPPTRPEASGRPPRPETGSPRSRVLPATQSGRHRRLSGRARHEYHHRSR